MVKEGRRREGEGWRRRREGDTEGCNQIVESGEEGERSEENG